MKHVYIIGNLVLDQVKTIDIYPNKKMLSNILKVEKSIGGCLGNVAYDLKKLDNSINVKGFGKVGDDENGKYIVDKLSEINIDTSDILIDKEYGTSFTDVMNDKIGERTFFHYRGANSNLRPEEIKLEKGNNLIHIGYLLLLDKFDEKDNEFGTKMARFLFDLKNKGYEVSLDLVSEESTRYKEIVIPSLKYCDYLIINEVEASLLTDIDCLDNGQVCIENIKKIGKKILDYGVKKKVIIHCPEVGVIIENNKSTVLGSLELPNEYIKGSVGAGDAFCAGCLYGIINNFDNKKILEIASCSAANNLASYDSISNAKDINKIMELNKKYQRRRF